MNGRAARATTDAQRSAQLVRTCHHSWNTYPRSPLSKVTDTVAVIGDHDVHFSSEPPDTHDDARCACMAMHVGQCFLYDA